MESPILNNLNESTGLPFIGRSTELQTLKQWFEKVVVDSTPKFVFVQGDLGVGKTALVNRFLEQVTKENPDVKVGKGVCMSEAESHGLMPFVELIESLQEHLQDYSPKKWMEFVKNVAPAWIDIFTFSIPSAVIKTMQEVQKLTGKTSYKQESIFIQCTNLLLKISEKQPLILFFDDLQWADASSLELLTHMTHQLKDRAIMFIFTYRTEAIRANTTLPVFNSFRAKTLRYEFGSLLEVVQGINVSDYIGERYPCNEFTPEFIRKVQEITQGHPLFLTQLCAFWQETKAILPKEEPDGGSVCWIFNQQSDLEIEIPTNIQVVLEQRLSLLNDDLRKLISTAAVEGDEFTAQILTSITKNPEEGIYDNLEKLEHTYRFIQEKETKKVGVSILDVYKFMHRFYRDFIYMQLSSGKKRLLHLAIGECLESLYEKNLYPIAGKLTMHFLTAGQNQKAVQYAIFAAQYEQSRYAWSDSEDWCVLGLKLLETLPTDSETNQLRLDLLNLSGDVYYRAGNFTKADLRFREALSLAKEIDVNPKQIVEIYSYLADTCESENHIEEMIEFIENGQKIIAANSSLLSSDLLFIKLSWLHSVAYIRSGRYSESLELIAPILEKALKLPSNQALSFIIARIYNTSAIAFSYLNLYEESLLNYKKSIELLESIGEIGLAAGYSVNLADDLATLGRYEEGLELVEKAIKITSQIGDLDDLQFAKTIKGILFLYLERYSEALPELLEAKLLIEQCCAFWNMSVLHAYTAEVYLGLNDLNSSYQQASYSLYSAKREKDPFDIGYAYYVLGQIYTVQQDWRNANLNFRLAIPMFEKSGNHHLAAKTQYRYAGALYKQNKFKESLKLSEKALKTFQNLKLEHEVAKIQNFLTEINK